MIYLDYFQLVGLVWCFNWIVLFIVLFHNAWVMAAGASCWIFHHYCRPASENLEHPTRYLHHWLESPSLVKILDPALARKFDSKGSIYSLNPGISWQSPSICPCRTSMPQRVNITNKVVLKGLTITNQVGLDWVTSQSCAWLGRRRRKKRGGEKVNEERWGRGDDKNGLIPHTNSWRKNNSRNFFW